VSEPLKITTDNGGEAAYFQRYINVGNTWVSGCDRHEAAEWERLQREAAVIASALAPADTVERQMALAVLAGDNAAALALADRLCETRRAGEDVWGGLLEAAKANIALLERPRSDSGGWKRRDYHEDEMVALREAIRKAEGKQP